MTLFHASDKKKAGVVLTNFPVPACKLSAMFTLYTDLRHGVVSEDSFKHGDTATYDDVITHVLHNGGRFSSHEGQQNWRLVQVPEQEQFPWNNKTR